VFGYTNHTVLPEALEKWSVELLGNLLPRHLEIIYLINYFWLEKVNKKYPGNLGKMKALSIVEESKPKMLKMASLVKHLNFILKFFIIYIKIVHHRLSCHQWCR